ncbi:KfrA protein [Rubellimicrobium mesophilum DSM 19309]|uniref:KfrA protein n=1 Tax=Rubellimicrobium mesophilum DSM 19309 TaxID=442562 RepID=A0A017HJZ7_9RHOB|nr:DNA-binding protein [Rubellimicrobium mesophilum]EYD74832.1 KfrA protein [Rubellimicrobium mesophilum DSM 19309]
MPQLTDDDVLQAAHELAGRGIEPTQTAVRAHLGHRGSYTTISRALRVWRAAQREREALEELPVPEEVERLAREISARVWKQACEIADIGKAELRRELAQLRAEMKAEAEAHDQVVEDLEAQLAGANAHEATMERQFNRYDAQSKAALADLRRQLAHERDTVRLLRQRAEQDAEVIAELREKLARVDA